MSDRQKEILKAIIEDHIEFAQPVASVELVQRRSMPVSGATVRNVMADLVKLGYLKMLHVSSGRTPTDRAYRYYISELMVEDELSVLEEVALKQKIMNDRYELERLLHNTAEALSEVTQAIGIAMTSDGYISYTGTSNIFNIPEFFEIEVARAIFSLLDDYDKTKEILEKDSNSSDITVMIGREIELPNMEPVSLISSRCNISGQDCYIGLIGPARTNYGRVIPITRYVCGLLTELGESL